MQYYSRPRHSHLSEKQVGHGAILLAVLDLGVTLVFEHVGATYNLSPLDWRVILAAFLICFGLFKYGQHITHHSEKMLRRIKEPQPEKYGNYDFRVIIGRFLTRFSQNYNLRKVSLAEQMHHSLLSNISKTKLTAFDLKARYELHYDIKKFLMPHLKTASKKFENTLALKEKAIEHTSWKISATKEKMADLKLQYELKHNNKYQEKPANEKPLLSNLAELFA